MIYFKNIIVPYGNLLLMFCLFFLILSVSTVYGNETGSDGNILSTIWKEIIWFFTDAIWSIVRRIFAFVGALTLFFGYLTFSMWFYFGILRDRLNVSMVWILPGMYVIPLISLIYTINKLQSNAGLFPVLMVSIILLFCHVLASALDASLNKK